MIKNSGFIVGIAAFLCVFLTIILMICVAICLGKQRKGKRFMKRKVIGWVLLLFACTLVVIITVALRSYKEQPVLTVEEAKKSGITDIWKARTSPERAAVINDNQVALDERLLLIENAKEEIILSTFDFRDDQSGSVMIGALLEAADRGVEIKILVDGMTSWLSMEWNPNFYALSSMDNVTIKLYNKANPLQASKSMGRLHDKYIIADRKIYILGGRNTYDYFLGDFGGYKNYDRDILVYCENPDENSSVIDLVDYFETIWNYNECTVFANNSKLQAWKSVIDSKKLLVASYYEYRVNNDLTYLTNDYNSRTVPVNNIALLSNPIEVSAKKPVVWYQLLSIMNEAHDMVKIHTPYIIANDYMYEGLSSIADNNVPVYIMTNSVANNGNPFGAADYYIEKENILSTGVRILEYEGGVSYHGKSILVDDNISIIGSFNMDMRSVYLDTELMLVVDSEELNNQLRISMEEYERYTRVALEGGGYDNPNNVVALELSSKQKRRIDFIKKFLYRFRYLF